MMLISVWMLLVTFVSSIPGCSSWMHTLRTRRSVTCRVNNDLHSDQQPSQTKRRRKKNKYAKFSKTEAVEKDPFELLMEETMEKQKELELDQLRKRKSSSPEPIIAPLPFIEFPDNKSIDPYDPTTFGYVHIGDIVGAHGVHGWVKIQSTTDFPLDRLCTPGIRHVKAPRKRAPRQVKLLEGKHRLDDEYLVRLKDVENRDDAIKLRGSAIYAREEEELEAPQEEYLIADLVNLDVYLSPEIEDENKGGYVGKVAGVVFAEEMCAIPGLGHDMLEVILPRGRNGLPSFRDEMVLIPFVPQIVPRVEPGSGVVYIDPPDGLLDLTYVKQEKVVLKGLLPPAN